MLLWGSTDPWEWIDGTGGDTVGCERGTVNEIIGDRETMGGGGNGSSTYLDVIYIKYSNNR